MVLLRSAVILSYRRITSIVKQWKLLSDQNIFMILYVEGGDNGTSEGLYIKIRLYVKILFYVRIDALW